jgi:hypothetical protein
MDADLTFQGFVGREAESPYMAPFLKVLEKDLDWYSYS